MINTFHCDVRTVPYIMFFPVLPLTVDGLSVYCLWYPCFIAN